MFETLSLEALQHYWWIIASLLGALLVFLLFVQGGQTLFGSIARNEDEKSMLLNSCGRKWKLTFTTLVTFGGVMFAAFPKFYATSFGGAYWVWIGILICFTIQAVSYEFRRKPGNFLGPRAYEAFLYINGSLGVFLLGAAVGTFFTGSEFRLDEFNRVFWQTPLRGIEAIFNVQNVALGLAVFSLSRVLGAQYFMNNIDHAEIFIRSRRQLIINSILFLIFFLSFLGMLLTSPGYAYDKSGMVSIEPYKYFNNFVSMPWVAVIFLSGVVLVLAGMVAGIFRSSSRGIWLTGTGSVLAVMMLFIISAFNGTSFYPSTFDPQSSLTIANSSSSHYTLTAMSYVSLMVPFVFAYIIFVWYKIDKKKITREEIKKSDHVY
jgi:cytochrome bd ubiquinol oxidase subunit II